MPNQFEKFREIEEMENIKPTPIEKKKPIELTKEEDEYFVDLLKKAKEAEKKGDLEQAIKLYLQYKEEYKALREKKEGKKEEKEEKEKAEEIKKNYEKYECIKTLKGHGGSVNSVIESHDGKYIISGSGNKTIKIWDKETGKCIKTLKGHGGPVYSVIESHDGKYIISGSGDETIKIWGEKEE